MAQKTILYSGYLCDPFAVSEAYTCFEWLKILLKEFNIVLLTTYEQEVSIKRFYGDRLPGKLKIIAFPDKYPFSRNHKIKNTLRLGYFYFNSRITSYLKKNPQVIKSCDLIFQKAPESFRYFTSLVHFGKPVYLGPLLGGLKPPPELKSYFKKEHFLYKLRNLDQLVLKLPVYKKQFSKIEKVLVTYDYIEDILPKEYLVRKKNILNVAIDTSLYPQATGDNETIDILFVGRLTRYKGTEFLIRALDNIKPSNWVLHIVGRGEEQEYLENLVKQFGLADKILFHGFMPLDEVKKYYQSATIFCLPTLTESAGNVFLEAMASGLPIITINNGGPKYICPDEGAIKIPISSAEGIISALEESITLLIGDPQKRAGMGRFNRAYCQANYDWKVLEKNILEFFNEEIEVHSHA